MADGALAKSYTMRNLDLTKADYYLGRDAIKLRLEKLKKERVNKLDTQKDLTVKKKRYEEQLKQLNNADMKRVVLDFTAVENMPSLSVQRFIVSLSFCQNDVCRINCRPGFR